MAWSFNPFTGNLDLVGGGAVVFEGEEETFDDLPVGIGDPPVGSSYLVRTSTGVWLVNRRQAGIWIRRNNTGVRATDWEYGGDYPVNSVNGQTGTVSLTASDVGVDFASPPAIGNTTPAAGSFTTLTSTDSGRTATLAGTTLTLQAGGGFNNVGIQSLTNVANSVSLFVGTASVFSASSTGILNLIQNSTLRWRASTNGPFSGIECDLGTEAANVLAQKNAANPQTFRIYNTFTDANNHERGFLRWSSNVFQIGTEKGSGGGTARALEFQTDGVTRMTIGATGPIVLSDNNTMEFRTSATKRTTLSTNANGGGLTIAYTSDLAGTSVDSGIFITGGVLRVTGSDSFGYGLRVTGNVLAGNVQSSAFGWTNNGNVGFAFNIGTISVRSAVTVFDLPVLARFGGTTSSFPALKRDTTSLQVKLADDSAFTALQAGNLVLTDNDGNETATFDAQSKLTANRTYDLPNASGTIALTNGATNLWIPASAWIPKTTAGCGVDSRELATNDQNFDELLFDTGSDEFADALVIMPSNYNNGTITARFYWTASSGSGGVAWAIQGRAFANDDALDTAAGTAQLVTDTLITANDMHITSATSAVTLGGTPAANTPIQFTIYRDVSDAADDLAVDARLLGVEIIYTAA